MVQRAATSLNKMQLTSHLSVTDKVHVLLIASYVGLSGIYWFPGIPYPWFAATKTALFITIIVLGMLGKPVVAKRQQRLLLGLIICAAAVPLGSFIRDGMLNDTLEAKKYLLPLLWLLALSGVNSNAYRFLLQALTITTTLFLIVAIYPVATHIGFLPDFLPPPELLSENTGDIYQALELGSIASGGFAGQSTSWGIIVPCMALLNSALLSHEDKSGTIPQGFGAVLILLSIASVAVTSARGGSMVLAGVWLYGVATNHRRRYAIPTAIMAIAALWSAISILDLLPDNYFRGFEFIGSNVDTLDAITTGRISTFVHAIDCFYASPLLGVGVEASRYFGYAIHNAFLKSLAEGGLIVFLPTIYVAANLLLVSMGKPHSAILTGTTTADWPHTRTVLLAGLILANMEPSSIFGNFNASASFWTAAWMSVTQSSKQMSSPT